MTGGVGNNHNKIRVPDTMIKGMGPGFKRLILPKDKKKYNLPADLTAQITKKINPEAQPNVRLVSKHFKDAVDDHKTKPPPVHTLKISRIKNALIEALETIDQDRLNKYYHIIRQNKGAMLLPEQVKQKMTDQQWQEYGNQIQQMNGMVYGDDKTAEKLYTDSKIPVAIKLLAPYRKTYEVGGKIASDWHLPSRPIPDTANTWNRARSTVQSFNKF